MSFHDIVFVDFFFLHNFLLWYNFYQFFGLKGQTKWLGPEID